MRTARIKVLAVVLSLGHETWMQIFGMLHIVEQYLLHPQLMLANKTLHGMLWLLYALQLYFECAALSSCIPYMGNAICSCHSEF
jgi:hypothetical protein